MCFAAQWALLMHSIAKANDHRLGLRVARLVMPMIVAAELCSWHAVLTTSNLGHVLEDFKAGTITKEQAIGGLAHVMAALDIGNTAEASNWFENGQKFIRDGA